MSLRGYPTAWAMFVLTETDRVEMADELWTGHEGGDVDLVRGMTLVAAVVRKVRREHAEKVGCDCGSDEWLERELLRAHEYEEEIDDLNIVGRCVEDKRWIERWGVVCLRGRRRSST